MPRKVKRRTARSTKGWRARSPRTITERRQLRARCGTKAFLLPAKLKFPVVPKRGPGCAVDCQGLRAAKARAAQLGYKTVARKADRMGRAAACHWAV